MLSEGQPWDTLHAAANAYAAMRWRVRAGALVLSSSLGLFGLAFWVFAEFRMLPNVRYRYEAKVAAAALSLAGLPVSALAVLPTDEPGIRYLGKFLSRASLFLSFVFAIISAETARAGSMTMLRVNIITLYMALATMGGIFHLRFADSVMMPPRAALAATWAAGHSGGRGLTTIYAVYGVTSATLNPQFNSSDALGLLVLVLAPQFYTVLTYHNHTVPYTPQCTITFTHTEHTFCTD